MKGLEEAKKREESEQWWEVETKNRVKGGIRFNINGPKSEFWEHRKGDWSFFSFCRGWQQWLFIVSWQGGDTRHQTQTDRQTHRLFSFTVIPFPFTNQHRISGTGSSFVHPSICYSFTKCILSIKFISFYPVYQVCVRWTFGHLSCLLLGTMMIHANTTEVGFHIAAMRGRKADVTMKRIIANHDLPCMMSLTFFPRSSLQMDWWAVKSSLSYIITSW